METTKVKATSKIIVNTLALIIIGSCYVFAADGGGGLHFGVKGGINFSTISGTYPDGSPSMITGFQLGGIVDIGINENFSVAPELLYTTKGAEAKTTVSYLAGNNTVTDVTDEKLTLGYIEIPILAKYKLSSGLFFEAGPYIGFLTSAVEKGTFTHTVVGNASANVYNSVDVSSTTGFSSADFGLGLGVGYQLTSGLGFLFRYDLGLSDIYNPSQADKYTNRTINISVFYMFGSK